MSNALSIATLGTWLAKSDVVDQSVKSVKKARDSFWEGLTRGDADAVAIVLVAAIIGGGLLAAYYFRNRA